MSGVTTATALIASAAIGAGAAIYEGQQQKKAAADAQAQRAAAAAAAAADKARQDQINADTRPTEQSAGQITFGSNQKGTVGSANDFLIPSSGSNQNSLGSSGRSGLGFA